MIIKSENGNWFFNYKFWNMLSKIGVAYNGSRLCEWRNNLFAFQSKTNTSNLQQSSLREKSPPFAKVLLHGIPIQSTIRNTRKHSQHIAFIEII